MTHIADIETEPQNEATTSLELLPGNVLEIDLELVDTIDPIRVRDSSGELVDVNPVVVFDDEDKQVGVFYRPSGKLLVTDLVLGDDGIVTAGSHYTIGHQGGNYSGRRQGDSKLSIERMRGHKSMRGKGDTLLVEYTGDGSVRATVDARAKIVNQHLVNVRNDYDRQKHKQERRFNRLDGARHYLGLLLIARSIILPGGVVDDLADRFHDAAVIMDDKKSEDPAMTDDFDGIPLGEYPAEFISEQKDQVDSHNAAVERMQDIIRALDSHDYDQIHEQAEEFRQTQADQLLGEEEVSAMRTAIDEAETPLATLEALNEFLGFYNKNAVFFQDDGNDNSAHELFRSLDSNTVNNGDLQRTAQNIITAYSHLPRDMLSEIDFDTIYLADSPPNPAGALFGAQAMYFGGGLFIKVGDRIFDAFKEGHDFLSPDRLEPSSQIHGILHETGHAYDDNLDLYAEAPEPDFMPSFFLTYLIGYQNRASLYGSMIGEENVAEVFSYTMDPAFMNHPDFVRYFSSDASNDELNLILEYEEQFPGFMAHLYEAKLPQDHHDRDQARDLIIGLVLYGTRPKRKDNRVREDITLKKVGVSQQS